jgi:hypothetical protein
VAVVGINAQTANYTLTTADAGDLVTMSNAAARTITVPTNAAQAIPVNTIIYLANINTGAVTVTPSATVTVTSQSSKNVLNGAGSTGMLIKTGTNTWLFTVTSRGLA